MAYSQNGDHDFLTNVALVKKRAEAIVKNNIFFRNFIGDVKVIRDHNSGKGADYLPSGAVIERMPEFNAANGSDHMLIPFIKPLSGAPLFGDAKTIGTEEQLVFEWFRTYIQLTKKAVMPKTGDMSGYITSPLAMTTLAMEQLADYMVTVKNGSFSKAIYEGSGLNTSAGTGDYGLGLSKRLHPNMMYASNADGTIAAVGTDLYTKTTTNMNSVFGNAANLKKLTMKHLNSFASYCRQRKIKKIMTKDGKDFWLLILHSKQIEQLKQDTTWIANQQYYMNNKGSYADPLFASAEMVVSEFIIYNDDTIVRSYTNVDANSGNFGTYYNEVAYTSTNFGAICLGASALAYADPESDVFRTEEFDYGQVKGIMGMWIDGIGRKESFTKTDEASVFVTGNASETFLSTAYLATNQSSALLFTGTANS